MIMNRRATLMLLLASITFASLPTVSVAETVILDNAAEANHNELRGNVRKLQVFTCDTGTYMQCTTDTTSLDCCCFPVAVGTFTCNSGTYSPCTVAGTLYDCCC